MIKALLYESKENQKVKCTLCPHFCTISPGKSGICGVRKNIKGELYSLNSDRIVALNADPIEKKPLYHFLPATTSFSIASSGCNFHCDFCQNHTISIVGNESDIRGEKLSPENIVAAAMDSNSSSIAYTYTEPTVFFELMKETAELASEKGLKNIMVTNGFISEEALDIISPYIDAANIDIKSFSDSFYRRYCGGRLNPVLDTVRRMKEKGIWIELTTLLIPELNTDEKETEQLMDFIIRLDSGIPWHVSRFFPVYKASGIKPTDTDIIEKVLEKGEKKGLKYLYGGNFFSEKWESTFCPSCGSRLIAREGYHTSFEYMKNGTCEKCGEIIPGVWE